mmetsp:Transcript_8424/g.19101  ORF Transcript_8424/g.19101 Transcript_8424/m.19101 type:complete len:216 (-) Transcript_8424:942-1589(-)
MHSLNLHRPPRVEEALVHREHLAASLLREVDELARETHQRLADAHGANGCRQEVTLPENAKRRRGVGGHRLVVDVSLDVKAASQPCGNRGGNHLEHHVGHRACGEACRVVVQLEDGNLRRTVSQAMVHVNDKVLADDAAHRSNGIIVRDGVEHAAAHRVEQVHVNHASARRSEPVGEASRRRRCIRGSHGGSCAGGDAAIHCGCPSAARVRGADA